MAPIAPIFGCFIACFCTWLKLDFREKTNWFYYQESLTVHIMVRGLLVFYENISKFSLLTCAQSNLQQPASCADLQEKVRYSFETSALIVAYCQVLYNCALVSGRQSSCHLLCMPPRPRDLSTTLNSAPPSSSTFQRCFAYLKPCKSFLRARPLFFALPCLWLTLSYYLIPYWSSLRAATPSTTITFLLHPDTSKFPECASLTFALSQSNHWLQSSHPHPSYAAAMRSCDVTCPTCRGGALHRHGMHISRSGVESPSPSSASATPFDAQLFYTALGATSSRSSACPGLVRAVDKQNPSSMTFLIRQLLPPLIIIYRIPLPYPPLFFAQHRIFPLHSPHIIRPVLPQQQANPPDARA